MSDATPNPEGPASEPADPPHERVVEWVDTDGLIPAEADRPGALVDGAAMWRRLKLVFTNDETAYVDLVDAEAITGGAVAVVSIFAAAIGGWLFVAIAGHDSLSITRVILASVLLGTIVATAAWLGWVAIVHWWLERQGHTVDHLRLVGGMGFASAPFSLSLLMLTVIPAFGVAVLSLGWWVLASNNAIAATVPGATPGRVRKANLVGFGAFAVILSVLAYAGGIAPGPFVFGRL